MKNEMEVIEKKHRDKNGYFISVNAVYEQICNICTLQSPHDMSVLIKIITTETEMASMGQILGHWEHLGHDSI